LRNWTPWSKSQHPPPKKKKERKSLSFDRLRSLCKDVVRCGSFICCSLVYLTHSTNPELSFSRKTSTPTSLFLSLNIRLYAIVPPPPCLLENNILEDWWLWLAMGFLWPLLKSDNLGNPRPISTQTKFH
jgi:hypothetical protein